MTDRDLLELAAKAAGLRVGREPDGLERGRYDLYWSLAYRELVWHGKSSGSEYPEPVCWNPLTDDGDALRLAVKLRMRVSAGQVDWVGNEYVGEFSTLEEVASDPLAATRRAIVRAAAEIGRNTT